MLKWFAFVLAGILAAPASAATVDTSGQWSGAVTYGWFGSGTSLLAPPGATNLESISFFFQNDAEGEEFDFWVATDYYSTNVLFEQTFTATSGKNTFITDIALEPRALLYTFIDFGDYAGYSTRYTPYDAYPGGIGYFLDANGYWIWDFSGATWQGGNGGLDDYYSQLDLFGDDLAYLLEAAAYWLWGRQSAYTPPEEFLLSPDLTFVAEFTTPIPLPATGLLLLSAFGGLVAFRRRKAA